MRFDGDATDKTECAESTASLYQLIPSTYDLPYSSANQTGDRTCQPARHRHKHEAQTGT